jgi:hypothetical protein
LIPHFGAELVALIVRLLPHGPAKIAVEYERVYRRESSNEDRQDEQIAHSSTSYVATVENTLTDKFWDWAGLSFAAGPPQLAA